MTRRWAFMLVKAAIFLTIFIAGFGYAVLYLWNRLAPDLFGLHPITFWQAVGLMVLGRLLFGGWRGLGGPGYGRRWRHRMSERWENMTPEEREKFREGLRGCGRFTRSAPEPKP